MQKKSRFAKKLMDALHGEAWRAWQSLRAQCPDSPRLQEPKRPRPSKLPVTDESSVQNILCQGTTFQVCAFLQQTHGDPTGHVILEAQTSHWLSRAEYFERGVICDRAKYFLSDVAEEVAAHGCYLDTAAKAAPWQIGQVERHGDIWKATFRRLVWSQQVSGFQEVQLATAPTNQAKNLLSRKSGFSPTQWVLGRDIRLPAT